MTPPVTPAAPLLLRDGLVGGRRQDIAVRDGRIERVGAGLDASGHETLDVSDRLVLPGFVESHIHPDKAFIADRTQGLRAGGPTPQTLVAELKKTFTVDVEELRKKLKAYLDKYGEKRPFPNKDRPLELKKLRVIAFVQNDKNGEVMQSAQVEVGGAE